MYAVVKTIATMISLILLIDRTGRRKLLMISAFGASAALWYIGGFVTATHIDLNQVQSRSNAGWVAIVCIYIYAVCDKNNGLHNRTDENCDKVLSILQAFFSLAWNGVAWVYCAEIFPARIKELAVSLTTATQWISQASYNISTNLKMTSI
jgi:MFS family permease